MTSKWISLGSSRWTYEPLPFFGFLYSRPLGCVFLLSAPYQAHVHNLLWIINISSVFNSPPLWLNYFAFSTKYEPMRIIILGGLSSYWHLSMQVFLSILPVPNNAI